MSDSVPARTTIAEFRDDRMISFSPVYSLASRRIPNGQPD
jgi:hypothetical protein